MKYKFILFAPWLFRSPVNPQLDPESRSKTPGLIALGQIPEARSNWIVVKGFNFS